MADDLKEKPIIEVKNFTAAYGDNVVIDDISFSVKRGEVFVILGGSGCGKSTLLKHMIGLYTPRTGTITINGRSLQNADGKARREILSDIGVTYQSGALFGSMNILQNVVLPLQEFTDLPPEAVELVGRMKLNLVGLGGFELYMPSEISGGMQKRAALARAMALDPEILFLDEPSAGLDPVTSSELDDLILYLSHTLGVTFVVVTHELPSVFKMADRAIMLDKRVKKIVAEGKPSDLKEMKENEFVYHFFNRQSETGHGVS